eukprot:588377-Pelagomonas_calceolata.AAC.3
MTCSGGEHCDLHDGCTLVLALRSSLNDLQCRRWSIVSWSWSNSPCGVATAQQPPWPAVERMEHCECHSGSNSPYRVATAQQPRRPAVKMMVHHDFWSIANLMRVASCPGTTVMQLPQGHAVVRRLNVGLVVPKAHKWSVHVPVPAQRMVSAVGGLWQNTRKQSQGDCW